jgi:hypothetical protein
VPLSKGNIIRRKAGTMVQSSRPFGLGWGGLFSGMFAMVDISFTGCDRGCGGSESDKWESSLSSMDGGDSWGCNCCGGNPCGRNS